LVSQIQDNIGTSYEWTLYNKKPWENNYCQEKVHSKRKEMLQKVPHIECKAGKSDELMETLRQLIKISKAALRFGKHIKLVEALTNKSPPGQVDRTIQMNGHMQRFQASVDMIEFEGLDNPSEQISLDKGNFATVRALILNHTFEDDRGDNKKMFLSITKK